MHWRVGLRGLISARPRVRALVTKRVSPDLDSRPGRPEPQQTGAESLVVARTAAHFLVGDGRERTPPPGEPGASGGGTTGALLSNFRYT